MDWKRIFGKKPAPAVRRRRAVKNEYEVQRRARETQKRVIIETAGEDGQFTGIQRQQMDAMIRSAYRCSALPRAIVLQRRLNIVGSVGGKVQFTTSSAEWNHAAVSVFRKWARSCDFVDGKSWNEVLQLIISSVDIGGDCVIVHDAWTPEGGVFCGSNKIRIFESDEIGNLPDSDFAARFPNHHQRAGKIYDQFGRFVGVTVSASQRGKAVFDPEASITLLRDPDAPAADCHWIYLQEAWRINQGRGVSTFAASVDLVDDFGNILSSETSAAKLNATIFGAYVNNNTGDEVGSDMDDYVFDEAAESDTYAVGGTVTPASADGSLPDGVQEFPDHHARSRGVAMDVLPPGYKMEIADSKRPNNNINEFLRGIAGYVASTFGLNQTYVTLEPQSSYTAFRGAQLLARPGFIAAQKMLERSVCDWIATRIIRDAIAIGILAEPADDFTVAMTWTWPHQEEVDATKEQQALTLKLKNGVLTMKDLHGDDWEQKVVQMGIERQAFVRQGLIYPASETVSGQVTEETEEKEQKNEEQN